MYYYPVMLDLKRKKCLVAGGGKVALRKVIGLLRAQASIIVISPEFSKHFHRFSNKVNMIRREIEESDITKDLALVIAATNIHNVNEMISGRANALNVPCNVVDQPDLCSFIVPAIVRRGDVTVAVSTNAASPRLSKYIKNKVSNVIGSEYSGIASCMAKVRLILREHCNNQAMRFALWEQIFETDPVVFIQKHGLAEYQKYIDNILSEYIDTDQHIGLENT
ncbi:MAG: bifunctional precorrin-2 dehydrogenase/sirohydrochlorin ferrochelatase [Fibrobacter sp.]|mgnify:CR=1 FL=1|nr:bifunctional precorrin-2 dehydrogenase/sirohydrochlorin ferrochelatase [Fibrobacter sp.]